MPNVRLNVCWMPRIIKKTILKNPIRMNLIKMNRIMGKRILTYQIFGKRILKNFDFIFYMWNNEYVCICFSTQYMWVKHCIQFRVFFFFSYIFSNLKGPFVLIVLFSGMLDSFFWGDAWNNVLGRKMPTVYVSLVWWTLEGF